MLRSIPSWKYNVKNDEISVKMIDIDVSSIEKCHIQISNMFDFHVRNQFTDRNLPRRLKILSFEIMLYGTYADI